MPRLASRDPATRWPWRVLINAAPEKPVWSCSQRQKGAVRSGSKVSTKFRGTQYLDNKRWKEKVLVVNAFNKAKAHSPNIVKIIRWHLYERSRERDRWTMGAKQDSSCLMFSSLRLQTSHLARRHTCQLYKFYLQRTSRSPTYHNTSTRANFLEPFRRIGMQQLQHPCGKKMPSNILDQTNIDLLKILAVEKDSWKECVKSVIFIGDKK